MKRFVITGSTKGIGFGLARELVLRGHAVMVSGRSQSAVDDSCSRIAAGGGPGKVAGCPADVSSRADHEALWDAALSAFSGVDVWINNAGYASTTHEIVDVPQGQVAQMVQSNMLGTMFGSQVAAQRMVAQGGGQIFNMLGGGSDGTIRAGMGVYGATKRGLDYFTRALTKELKQTQVAVCSIRPGMVVTEGMLREAREDPSNFAKYRRIMNILCDEVDDVAPYLVDQILAARRTGTAINWLSTGRVTRKFLLASFKRRDLFAPHGL